MADPLKALLAKARQSSSWEEFQANCSKLEHELGYTKFIVGRHEDRGQNLEEQTGHLLGVGLLHAQELMAMDILLKALIASHHDTASLKLSLQVLSEALFDQSRELGFNSGTKPTTAKDMESGVRRYIDRWLAMLEPK
jgi:hypothetical protein